MASNDPVLPLEMLDGILSHLEKEDLLNCRFVSKAWNKLCFNHLNKSNSTIKLRSDQIKEYTDFIKSTGAPPILGIRVSQQPNTPLALLAKYLDSLIDYTGPECIIALELCHLYDPDYAQFLYVLERMSLGLMSLHINYGYYGKPKFPIQQPQGITEFTSRIRAMRFPKLEHLKCGGWLRHSDMNPEHVSLDLIGGCPSLQVLEYIQGEQIPVNIPFERGLKSLALSFEASDPTQVVQQIQASQSQMTLNALALKSKFLTVIQFQGIRQILQELSPHLKSLALSVSCHCNDPIPCPMQVLRVLDIRGIDYLDMKDRGSPMIQNLRPALLPSLTEISFPMGLYYKNNIDLPLRDSEVFYSVRNITTCFQRWRSLRPNPTQAMSPTQIQKCWTHIFNVFPNATVVTVQKNELWEDLDLEVATHCLVQCPQAVGVQELTVMNYETDYIGDALHVLDNPPSISFTLENFKITGNETGGYCGKTFVADLFGTLGVDSNGIKITSDPHSTKKQVLTSDGNKNAPRKSYLKNVSKLRLLRGLKPYKRESTELTLDFDADLAGFPGVQILHVDLFAKHFPNLRSLELSSKILSSNYFEVWKKIRQIETRYPTWAVNATYHDFKWNTIPATQ